jgi:DNA-binding NarL/FixJ family response regulator
MELGAPMAEAYCAQGRLGEATQIIADTLALTRATGARHYEAMAWRVQGQICAAHGMADDAAQAFGSAIALCEALGSRLELAHALYQRGTLHQTRDNIEAAHADWMRAYTLCEHMGAHALLWRTHAALGQLARAQQHLIEAEREFTAARTIVEELAAQMRDESFRASLLRRAAVLIPVAPLALSRSTMKAEFGGLTERERTVAALIARGHSNREIAQALVVSERTVTTHVSNIFAKLGFTSREQVARWAGEKGLVTPTAQ